MSIVRLAVTLIALLSLPACTTTRYLLQAGCGQLELSLGGRDIAAVARDPRTSPRTSALLARIGQIKRFGEKNGLTATKSYSEYVDLERDAAVWVVTAAEPLGFRTRTWSFPIAGEVPYLGWFRREDADDYASDLRDDGWDVDVRGAGAYSTLGWFDDPVLSTMIPEGDQAVGELANVVLHESVHASFYVASQSILNESVANFMGDRLTEAYLDEALGHDASETQAYLEGVREGERRSALFRDARRRLESLYASNRSRGDKLADKRSILAALRTETGIVRQINNATLAQYEIYNTGSAKLEALLAACGGSWRRFLGTLHRLTPATFAAAQERNLDAVILPLVRARCPAPG